MKWITRKHIRVNRVATAWLIRRFIDHQAEFIFVDPAAVPTTQERENGQGFDAPGATYPHKDGQGRCSFEALVDEYFSNDAVLEEMARMVRGADFADETNLTEESAGIRTISQGFPLVSKDDQETVEKAGFLYDALYASIKARQSSKPTA